MITRKGTTQHMKLARILLLVVVAAGLAGCNNGSDTPTPAPRPTITTTMVLPPLAVPKPLLTQFADGKYEVGTDIAAGQYKTAGPEAGAVKKCYWARLKDFTGAVTSVNAMQYGQSGPDVVVIEPTDKGFETRACGTWTLVKK